MELYLSSMTLLFGSSFVFYSLSPYYSALGLAIVSISGCFLMSCVGASFLALILLLIYMGGMLVVFIYSSALSTDRFPLISKTNEMMILLCFIMLWVSMLHTNVKWNTTEMKFDLKSLMDMESASYLLNTPMALFFILAGYILLMALVIVLYLSRGVENTTLRAI